jgi:hypothetical protein
MFFRIGFREAKNTEIKQDLYKSDSIRASNEENYLNILYFMPPKFFF